MIDAILYIPSMTTLHGWFLENQPENLSKDSEGNIENPPSIVGFTTTPAKVFEDKLLVYMRLTKEQEEQWINTPHVEVLAKEPFHGKGTASKLYNEIFNDPVKLDKYKSVYDFTPYETTDEFGKTITITPPEMFGIIAGA